MTALLMAGKDRGRGADPPRPAIRDESDPPSATTTGRASTGPVTSTERVAHVLIVEDNAALRETLGEILLGSGYEVTDAGEGHEALALLRRNTYEVLILDLHLPGRDGLDILEHVDVPPPVVVILSAFEYYTEHDVQTRVGPKVFRSLRKPIGPTRLLQIMDEAVEEWRGIPR